MAAAPGPWYRDLSWRAMTPAEQAQYTIDAMRTPPMYRHVPNNQFSAPGRFLGSGRNSVAGLWLQQDAANRVVQRMVIKKKKLHPFWLDHPQLHYASHHVNNIPREIYCLRISRGQTWPRNVIRLDGSKKLRAEGEIREFREYAPFGTLNDLIRMHKRRKLYNRSGKKTFVQNEPLQEAFLWCVFEGLANAVHGMANVRIPLDWGHPVADPFVLPGGQGGTEVVHGDIKLSKVLLGSPAPNIFPHYPQVKVTGFDFAYLTNPNDATGRGNINPWQSLIQGPVPGFAPPELDSGNRLHPNYPFQLSFAQPGAPPGAPAIVGPFIPVPPIIGGPNAAPASVSAQDPTLSTRALSYSNVWQIGMIMRSLMRLEEETDVIANAIDYWATPRWGPPPAPGMPPVDSWEPPMVGIPPVYSRVLVTLVRGCLLVDPARRPSPLNLLATIRFVMPPFIGNMRFAPANNRRSRHHLTRLDLKSDDYQVGDDTHDFPRPRPRPRH